MVDFFLFLIIGTFLFVLPGFFMTEALAGSCRLSLMEKVGLACSFSLSLYPVFFLWLSVVGIKAMAVNLALPIATVSLLFFWKIKPFFRMPNAEESKRSHVGNQGKLMVNENMEEGTRALAKKVFSYLGPLALLLLFFSRWLAVKGMVAPAWGDSVHHSLIIKLILKTGGLFKSWAPYAALDSLTYHFGLHSAVACWASVAGASAHKALLAAGQFLNALCVVAFFPLAVRLAGSRWVGWGAIIFAGFLLPLPGYFVNWGRYTHLAGMIILAGVLWIIDRVFGPGIEKKFELEENLEFEKRKAEKRKAARVHGGGAGIETCLGFFLAGLFLTHYSIFAMALAALAAWLVLALVKLGFRTKPLWPAFKRIGLAGLLGAGLVLPWLWRLGQSRLPELFLINRAQQGSSLFKEASDIGVWRHLDFYFADFFLVTALVALLLAMVWSRRMAWLLLLLGLISFSLANLPYSLFPERRLISNAILVMSLFVPISFLLAWTGSWLMKLLIDKVAFISRKIRFFSWLLIIILSGLLCYGTIYQARLVNPFFQMVTANDLAAFNWIRNNTSARAKFFINGFLIYKETTAVGSDAGWWLPYFTGRQASIPPLVYNIERLRSDFDRQALVNLIKEARKTQGEAVRLRQLLKQQGFNFIFLGEKRGSVGYDAGELIPENWLRRKKEFKLLFQQGKAQVWKVVD